MKAYLLGLLIVMSTLLHAQKNIPVYFDFCNYYWRYPVIDDSATIDVKYNDKVSKLKIYMKSWKGASDFLLFSKEGQLLLEGHYINSLAVLRNYITVRTNAIDGNAAIEVIDFYRPLKHGTWRYYKNGEATKEEKYANGILVE